MLPLLVWEMWYEKEENPTRINAKNVDYKHKNIGLSLYIHREIIFLNLAQEKNWNRVFFSKLSFHFWLNKQT
jgi:hypothetical protein